MHATTKTIGLLPNGLYFRDRVFVDFIGFPMPKVRQNLSQILAKHAHFLDYRVQPRVCGSEKAPLLPL